jgi:hypothetical protein
MSAVSDMSEEAAWSVESPPSKGRASWFEVPLSVLAAAPSLGLDTALAPHAASSTRPRVKTRRKTLLMRRNVHTTSVDILDGVLGRRALRKSGMTMVGADIERVNALATHAGRGAFRVGWRRAPSCEKNHHRGQDETHGPRSACRLHGTGECNARTKTGAVPGSSGRRGRGRALRDAEIRDPHQEGAIPARRRVVQERQEREPYAGGAVEERRIVAPLDGAGGARRDSP